jgi:(p)ppGpp synthase/HD superfamily hydrolase
MNLISRATAFAMRKHAGQSRKYSDEPYMVHLLAVAELVSSIGASDKVVAAAILHDTLEDTATTVEELEREFGPEIASLVIEVTDVYVSGAGHGNRAERKAKERERLASVSANAQTIKVADLIDNTGSIVERDPDFAKLYLTEKAALLGVLTKADPKMLAKVKR